MLILESIKDISKYTVFRIISIILGAVSLPLLARFFDTGNYGIYAIYLTSLSFYIFFSSSWIKDSFMRFYHDSHSKNESQSLVSTSFLLIATINGCVAIGLLISNLLFSYAEWALLAIIIGLGTFKSINFLFISYLRTLQEIVKLSSFQLLQKFSEFYIGLPILLAGLLDPLNSIIIGMVIGELIITLYCVYFLVKHNRLSLSNWSTPLIGQFAQYGVPLVLTGLMSTILMASDRYLILYFLGKSATGVYSFAYDICQKTVAVVPQLVALSLWPILLKHSHENFESTLDELSTFFKAYVSMVAPGMIVFCIFSNEILTVLGTAAYAQGAALIPYIIAGIFIASAGWYWNCVFMLKKQPKIILVCYALSAAVNVILNIVLIPNLGILGAAIATVISYIVLFGTILGAAIRNRPSYRAVLPFMVKFSAQITIGLGLYFAIQSILTTGAPFIQKIIALTPLGLLYGVILLKVKRRILHEKVKFKG